MKYYKCSKDHWWYCADTKILRQGHVCRRGARKCSLPLAYQGTSIPSKTKPEGLAEDQIKDDVTVTKEQPKSDQPPQSGSANPLVFLSPTPQPSSSSSNDIAQTTTISTTPVTTSYYRCLQGHMWRSQAQVRSPEQVKCPRVTIFAKTCDASLSSLPGGSLISGAQTAPFLPSTLEMTSMPIQVFHNFEQQPVISTESLFVLDTREQRSQEDLTKIFANAPNITFMCRNGLFVSQPLPPTKEMGEWEFVDEPGFVNGCCLRMADTRLIVGRHELGGRSASKFNQNPYIKGTVTYPDFACSSGSRVYAVELKTPRKLKMKEYLTSGFFEGTSKFENSRTIEEEIVTRAELLPEKMHQMFAFDLINMGLVEAFDATIAALQVELKSGKHPKLWSLITGFLFVKDDRSVVTFNRDTILEYGTTQTTLRLMPQSMNLTVNNNNASSSNDPKG